MPSYTADKPAIRPPISPPAMLGLSPIDRLCIGNLVGHTLARIEREFILQTLRSHHGNRTRAADRLGISVRSLRDRIRNYRGSGESIPEPGNLPSPKRAEQAEQRPYAN
jgi:two-component system, response regulator FlrC